MGPIMEPTYGDEWYWWNEGQDEGEADPELDAEAEAELAQDQILERQELEDFEGLNWFDEGEQW